MTLHIIDVEQGTDEWFKARAGLVTASIVGQLITRSTLRPANNDTSRAITATLVAERLTGVVEETFKTADMRRGHMLEPFARDLYSEHYEEATECGFMVREFPGFRLGFSPDGLVGDRGLIEIKSPRAKTHVRTLIEGQVPAGHMAQIQAGLLVSGREWADFVSYCPGHPLFVERVHPDDAWEQAIIDATALTETNAEAMITAYHQSAKGRPATPHIDPYDLEIEI